MRTTIDIEDDVLEAAKEIARREHISAGRVISRLLRTALTQPTNHATDTDTKTVGGFRPFNAPDARIVSNDKVNQLRDEEGV